MIDKLSDAISSVSTVILLILMGAGVGVFFLARGIAERSGTAYFILGGIVFLVVAGIFVSLGGAGVLGVVYFAHKMQSAREQQEQARFVDNAKENLAMMVAMQRNMNMQNQGLMRQVREQQKMLPEPGGDDPDAWLEVDAAVFDGLDD